MKTVLTFIAVLALATLAFGNITYNRCSLAKRLASLGVPRSEMAIWTCLAERESSYRSWVVGPANSDGSNDYGLFQINDRYWCQPANGKFSYNACHVNCNTLLGDDLLPILNCARQVKNQQGWTAWSTWQYCSGNLPSIDSCF